MTKEEALAQYKYEVALFEQWGQKNVTTFEEWLVIKGISINQPSPLPDIDEAAKEYQKEHTIYFHSIPGCPNELEYDIEPEEAFKAGAEWSMNWLTNRFKFLPYWKPSDKQMTALNWFASGGVNGPCASEMRRILRELYNDLKKLWSIIIYQ